MNVPVSLSEGSAAVGAGFCPQPEAQGEFRFERRLIGASERRTSIGSGGRRVGRTCGAADIAIWRALRRLAAVFPLLLASAACSQGVTDASIAAPRLYIQRYAPLVSGQPVKWQALVCDSRGVTQRSAGSGERAWCIDASPPDAATAWAGIREMVRALPTKDEARGEIEAGETGVREYYTENWVFILWEGKHPLFWSGERDRVPAGLLVHAEVLLGPPLSPIRGPAAGWLLVLPLSPREQAEAGRLGLLQPIGIDDVVPPTVYAAVATPGLLLPITALAAPVRLEASSPIADVLWLGRGFRLRFFSSVPLGAGPP
jgi:hypothetical protein